MTYIRYFCQNQPNLYIRQKSAKLKISETRTADAGEGVKVTFGFFVDNFANIIIMPNFVSIGRVVSGVKIKMKRLQTDG